MAVRIRKLARELNRTPAEIIGVLHAIGIQRYRSADDMLPAPAEARLRTGIRTGVAPVYVELDGPPEPEPVPAAPVRLSPPVAMPSPVAAAPAASAVSAGPPSGLGGDDLMARLVPGVVRQSARHDQGSSDRGLDRPGDRASSRGAPVPSRPAPGRTGTFLGGPAAPAPSPSAAPRRTDPRDFGDDLEPVQPTRTVEAPLVVDGEWRALQAERAAVESHRRLLESERAVIEAERDAVDEDRRRVEAQVRALDSERTALEGLARALDLERRAIDNERQALSAQHGRLRASELVPVQNLLEERGLRGADELERGLVALAQARLLRDVLWTLRVESPDLLRRVLTERLVLVDQGAPEAIARTAAVVSVSPDRAEVPSATALAKILTPWSEALLLRGVRRLTLVGGRPLWHRLLRDGLDTRLEIRFVPVRPDPGATTAVRDGAQAASDVERSDLVILWGVSVLPTARVIYNAARALVIEVEEAGLADMVSAVVARLRA